MQENISTARHCGLSPVRIQEALFIGRSLERLRKFQEIVDEIQKDDYNEPELFTDEPEVHTLQEGSTTTMMDEDIQSESDKRKQDISDDFLMEDQEMPEDVKQFARECSERVSRERGPVRFP